MEDAALRHRLDAALVLLVLTVSLLVGSQFATEPDGKLALTLASVGVVGGLVGLSVAVRGR